LVGKLEGKKPVERPGRGMEVNIEMGLKIINRIDFTLSDLEQGPVMGCCERGNERLGWIDCG